jgi:hypothetical protein
MDHLERKTPVVAVAELVMLTQCRKLEVQVVPV